MSPVPPIRIFKRNDRPIAPSGEYVLYWMIANRRLSSNFSLDRAIELATELKKPLVVLEALRVGYQWASDRIHSFVIEGMRDNLKAAAGTPVYYYPYIENSPGMGKGLLSALSARSCAVVTDYFPCFMLPHMVAAAAKQSQVHFEEVDSNGIFPIRAGERTFVTAYDFRRYLQKHLAPHLTKFPNIHPLKNLKVPKIEGLPAEILSRWAPADLSLDIDGVLKALPIDHSVSRSFIGGGSVAAHARLQKFLTASLPNYSELRNDPDADAASGLSPYLHFGHISVHEIFSATVAPHGWGVGNLAATSAGKRNGWWGLPEHVEGFLDELITWREIGYNMCSREPNYGEFDSLPPWARKTLGEHTTDTRLNIYSLNEFESARTHDPLWNAAQRQLVTEGKMHNYLRMLWGKKILEWSPTPEDALATMVHLNNKYALDGRNPNSYTGIMWVLGRYDRPWGPERKIFGTIRYMSSDNTAKKLNVKNYLTKYGDKTPPKQMNIC